MTRYLLVFALLFLMPDAQAQAVRPAPVPTPLIQQQPPSHPGNPVYTPPGAGASHGGLPGASKAALPPSPNKRALPDDFDPKKQPGLWAADGAPRASAEEPPPLFGVVVPHMENANEEDRFVTRRCMETMAGAAVATGANADTVGYPPHVRNCLTSALYSLCAIEMRDIYTELRKAGEVYEPEHMAALNRAVKDAREYVDANCSEVALTTQQQRTMDTVYNFWRNKMRESTRSKK